jgi:hypothetical protein
MAYSYKSFQNVGVTTETTIYTGAASTEATVIGMSIANTTLNDITVDVKLNTAHVVKNAVVPSGTSFVPIGGDQKLVVEATDTIKVTASASADVVLSVLEIT